MSLKIGLLLATVVIVAIAVTRFAAPKSGGPHPPTRLPILPGDPVPAGLEQATFGNGCFWCTEAVYQQIKGVKAVKSGYTGGAVPNPTY